MKDVEKDMRWFKMNEVKSVIINIEILLKMKEDFEKKK